MPLITDEEAQMFDRCDAVIAERTARLNMHVLAVMPQHLIQHASAIEVATTCVEIGMRLSNEHDHIVKDNDIVIALRGRVAVTGGPMPEWFRAFCTTMVREGIDYQRKLDNKL